MDNENTQLSDINVGNLDFQPISKRFMVWDKENKTFLTHPMEVWQIVVHFRNRFHQLYDDNGSSRYVFCQSTNLFDKDGKEIWEGSIVKGKVSDNPKTKIFGAVVYRQQAFWIMNIDETHSEPLLEFSENELENISHILSNPELVEEK